MQPATLNFADNSAPEIVCIGAHSDDIEIGCGGTLRALLTSHPRAVLHWIVLCSEGQRAGETIDAAAKLLPGGSIKPHVLNFRDGYLPYHGAEVKDALKGITQPISADLVFTHYSNDAHQDHRLASELTYNLFRNELILEYEIPKYDGDLGSPNIYVALDQQTVESKISVLLSCFATQANKHWFTDDTFRSLMRLRGIEAGRDVQFAEAFYSRKLLLAALP